MDIVSREKRSRMMAGIRAQDTKPELIIRKALHAGGYRYRVNQRRLPGSPDVVMRKFGAVILVNGCFWHGHNCPLFKVPESRTEFWRSKIAGNQERDLGNIDKLISMGWRVCVIWECVLRGREARRQFDTIIGLLVGWINSDFSCLEIDRGTVQQSVLMEETDTTALFAAESARFGVHSHASLE